MSSYDDKPSTGKFRIQNHFFNVPHMRGEIYAMKNKPPMKNIRIYKGIIYLHVHAYDIQKIL